MSRFSPLERLKVDCLIQTNTTSSSLYNQMPVSLKGVDRLDVLMTVGAMPATGDLVQLAIVGGTANCPVTAMAALTNATVSVGSSSTKGTVWGAQLVRINIAGTVNATGISLVVDGSTFTAQGAANATAYQFQLTTATTLTAKSLTTVLKQMATRCDATYVGTTGAAATVMYVDVWLKDYGATGLKVEATAQNSTGIAVRSMLSQGVVSIKAADLLATNASYSDIGVLVNCTGSSAIPVAVHCIRTGHGLSGFPPWNAVFHKKDLSTSGAK